ncbi:hypothetical protein FRC10_002111 [Ceratobasidium sp. 414]|nr:hypothetical protein FRC10_002111 [Ceratobasidium sp. 414]
MDSALGQSNGNTSSSSRSLRQRAARLFSDKVASPAMRGILPLPGLHELTSVAETLVDILRVDLPYEHDRWSTLALKIQYLIDIAVDMMELDPIGVQKLKCDLEETKIAFEGASSPRRLDFRKAKRHVQALEDLERKVDALIELAKGVSHTPAAACPLQMKLQVQLVFAHQDDGLLTTQDSRYNQFKVIKAYEIRGQKILPPTHGKRKHQQRLISSGRQSVAACHHSGKFGRQPVVYVTYSSANVIDTEKVCTLDCLTLRMSDASEIASSV